MDDAMMRAACAELIAQMPHEGLEDAMVTLRGYLDYYSTVRPPAHPLPEPVLVPAVFLGVFAAPPLYIDAEGD